MNIAHWHLVLVHIPIVMVPLGASLISLGQLKNWESLRQTSMSILVIAGLAAIAAFLTGDGAEEIVEHLPGISEALIEAHEEAAEVSLWLCIILALISAFLLVARSLPLAQKLGYVVIAVAWTTSGGLAYTGFLGGKIRHPEAYETSQIQSDSGSLEHRDDDD